MFEEKYVTYEQAVKLKELGFPQEPIGGFSGYRDWSDNYECSPCEPFLTSSHLTEGCYRVAAPTLGLVKRWLIDNKYMFIDEHYDEEGWSCEIRCYHRPLNVSRMGGDEELGYDKFDVEGEYLSYDEMISAAIDKAIELLNDNDIVCFLPFIGPEKIDFKESFKDGYIDFGEKEMSFYNTILDTKPKLKELVDIIVNNSFDKTIKLYLVKCKLKIDSDFRLGKDRYKNDVYIANKVVYLNEIPLSGIDREGFEWSILDKEDLEKLKRGQIRHNFFHI